MAYRDLVLGFITTRPGRWIGRMTAAHLDPLLYRLTGGRLTTAGPQVMPQLVLVTTGRKSGRERRVQLVYHADGDDFLLVASNWGGERHPGWSYNLDAGGATRVLLRSNELPVTVRRVTGEERDALWPAMVETCPPWDRYLDLTDRDLKLYRLSPASPA